MLNVAFADDLSIQILREIKFSNGFGQIEAKPILKNVNKDIKVMGEYNVDEKSGNVVMKIDKVLYGGKIYDLSEEFNVKRRLKNPKTAVLKTKSKIKLSGGSHPELLAILNDENTSGKKVDGKSNNSANNSTASNASNTNQGTSSGDSGTSYYSRGYGSSSGSSQYPYYGYGSGSSGSSSDKSSPTTDSNGNCKSPEIRDGMAYVYPPINGICTQKAIAESNVYKKQNTSTCPNKTDYENMAVSIGEEQFAIIDDTEYRVKSCYYTDTIQLQATTDSCKVIPDYDKKQGRVQKQYWYILNNERVNTGSCVPTGEIIAIYDDDYNSCKYRFDFENNVAIKQTQWYHRYENKKTNLGECVDVSEDKLPKMTYAMYESVQGCDCKEVDGMKLCQSKLAFNGMNNTKEDATECRYINAEGMGLIDEFVGNYSFKDDSRQAVKKINQYFEGVGGEKIYVAKDKETNQSFPYKEMSCGWEHNNDKKLSYHKTRFIIKDPALRNLPQEILDSNPKIQGDEYEVKGCEAVVQSVLYWQQQLELAKGKKTGEHKRQVAIPENLDAKAKRWSLPMIKTKNASGAQIEAMLEEGETPIWNSNFKAQNLELNRQNKGWSGWSKWQYEKWGDWYPKTPNRAWNWYYKDLKVDNMELGNFVVGWTLEKCPNNFTLDDIRYTYIFDFLPYGICKSNYKISKTCQSCNDGGCSNFDCSYHETKQVNSIGLNNPLTATSNITHAYSITLPQPIVIKPTKIDMNENITSEQGEDSIFYKTITQEIIDPNTKQCVKYPESEFVLDSNGKKQCVGKAKQENGKNKIGADGEVECADNQGYKKHNDWNPNKAGQCKTQDIRLFTTGVTFTPNYDKSPIDTSKQYCKAGETQSFEAIEETRYEFPEVEVTDNETTQENEKESSYYKLVKKHENDAKNVDNYQKSITKVLCTADNEKSNMNAYIIGAVVNHYKNQNLTKLEVESLKDMSLTHHDKWGTDCKNCSVFQKWKKYNYVEQWLTVNFSTKDNWVNNQTIYEHEMYRPFRRPDGTTFYLYERQGFFTNEPKVNCADCARDDELNG